MVNYMGGWGQDHLSLICYFGLYFLCRFGYVEYSSVDEAKAVFESPENIILDGRRLFIDYASPHQRKGEIISQRDKSLVK